MGQEFDHGRAAGLKEAAEIISLKSRSLKAAYEQVIELANDIEGGAPVLLRGSIMKPHSTPPNR